MHWKSLAPSQVVIKQFMTTTVASLIAFCIIILWMVTHMLTLLSKPLLSSIMLCKIGYKHYTMPHIPARQPLTDVTDIYYIDSRYYSLVSWMHSWRAASPGSNGMTYRSHTLQYSSINQSPDHQFPVHCFLIWQGSHSLAHVRIAIQNGYIEHYPLCEQLS